MSYLEWSDKLSVGVREIDNQHKGLIDLVNKFYDAMEHERASQETELTLKKLAAYAVHHFQTEETYMNRFKYPGYLSHKLAHEEFTKKITEFQQAFEEKKHVDPMALIAFLNVWIVNHIKSIDKQYSETFVKNGLT
ncbi:MAG TPA: bacteriohemerythrin [Methanoregulaceae archaeon]|nr:bacteriohemerythrin [Methanoregulaceae archaeon]